MLCQDQQRRQSSREDLPLLVAQPMSGSAYGCLGVQHQPKRSFRGQDPPRCPRKSRRVGTPVRTITRDQVKEMRAIEAHCLSLASTACTSKLAKHQY